MLTECRPNDAAKEELILNEYLECQRDRVQALQQGHQRDQQLDRLLRSFYAGICDNACYILVALLLRLLRLDDLRRQPWT